jgi:hypothetical protein
MIQNVIRITKVTAVLARLRGFNPGNTKILTCVFLSDMIMMMQNDYSPAVSDSGTGARRGHAHSLFRQSGTSGIHGERYGNSCQPITRMNTVVQETNRSFNHISSARSDSPLEYVFIWCYSLVHHITCVKCNFFQPAYRRNFLNWLGMQRTSPPEPFYIVRCNFSHTPG